ncbi:DUF4214 domain-containing protein [Massilia antarctica]|uniref:DUF4214 domain-containing protein n=1 Tax=Massilia antarctica TaxID=2765360 RepID=UPI0006BB6F75|nr:DUF4214 domain-containing protein [Massilia sp. H27-R4]
MAVTPKAQGQQTALVINVESLRFADTTLAVEHRSEQSALAGLYKEVLGRQADYQGFEFWAQAEKNGVTLGHIALEMISSPESQLRHPMQFNGVIEHDLELLYVGIFGRHSDAPGFAFWPRPWSKACPWSTLPINSCILRKSRRISLRRNSGTLSRRRR